MKEVIDLYSKLTIGIFSFIGPSFTLLIPLFYNAIEKSKDKHENMLANLQLVIKSNLDSGSKDFTKQIVSGKKEIDKLIRQNKIELNLLSPKRQVRRLFGSLFTTIFLIGFYYFQHSHFWKQDINFCSINYEKFRAITIILSFGSFIYCIRVLWQMFCTIIRIRSEEEQNKKQKTTLGKVS